MPYEVAGEVEGGEWSAADYMLLCGSCNRAKSWSCEHCENWLNDRLSQVCQTCYWANPENYVHIALKEVRRADILWSGEEVRAYDRLKKAAQTKKHPIPEYVKKIIEQHLDEE